MLAVSCLSSCVVPGEDPMAKRADIQKQKKAILSNLLILKPSVKVDIANASGYAIIDA